MCKSVALALLASAAIVLAGCPNVPTVDNINVGDCALQRAARAAMATGPLICTRRRHGPLVRDRRQRQLPQPL
jgi:hypothetical protein